MTSKPILIGQGADNDINWESDFEIIEEIEHQLMNFEFASEQHTADTISPLELLQSSVIPSFMSDNDYCEDIFTFLQNMPHVSFESTLHDPDQPCASYWQEVYVEKENVTQVLRILEALHSEIIKLSKKLGIDEQVKQLMSDIAKEKALSKVASIVPKKICTSAITHKTPDQTLSTIEAAMSSEQKNLSCEGKFLMQPSTGRVFVLTAHEWYSKEQGEHDQIVSDALHKSFKVIELKETCLEGSSWIPYFAGQGRKFVMGWNQVKSILIHKDPTVLAELISIRQKFMKQQRKCT